MAASDPVLLVERGDGFATLTLNRPAKRNALSVELRDALSDALDDLASDSEIKAVVITGAGTVFSAGFDLSEFDRAAGDADFSRELWASSDRYHEAVLRFPLHGVQNDLFQGSGNFGIQFSRGDRVPGQTRVHHDKRICTFEGHRTSGHFVEDGPQAVEIGSFIPALSSDLFGRHVIRCAHRRGEPGKGQPAHLGRLGDPEVYDPEGSITTDHDVLRLKIAMHNLVFVHMSERTTNVAGDSNSIRQEPGTRLTQQRA